MYVSLFLLTLVHIYAKNIHDVNEILFSYSPFNDH